MIDSIFDGKQMNSDQISPTIPEVEVVEDLERSKVIDVDVGSAPSSTSSEDDDTEEELVDVERFGANGEFGTMVPQPQLPVSAVNDAEDDVVEFRAKTIERIDTVDVSEQKILMRQIRRERR